MSAGQVKSGTGFITDQRETFALNLPESQSHFALIDAAARAGFCLGISQIKKVIPYVRESEGMNRWLRNLGPPSNCQT